MADVWGFVVALAAVFVAGGVGQLVTAGSLRAWYPTLRKPWWNPPNGVFGPVWTALYAVMALAAWLVWRERGVVDVVPALALFALQLVLNSAWSLLFFGLRRPAAALVEMVFLWAAIAATIAAFAGISALGAWLLVPYLAWVTFAAALNAAIWRLNPG